MKRSLYSSNKKNAINSTMDIDEQVRKSIHMMAEDDMDKNNTSEEDSEASSQLGDQGYETGDSEAIGSDEEGSEMGSVNSESFSTPDDEHAMDTSAQPIEELEEKVISKANKLLRASITEELDRMQIMPNTNSEYYDDAHEESNIVRTQLKRLKTTMESFNPTHVVWKPEKSHPNSISSPAAKILPKQDHTQEFDASKFLLSYFKQWDAPKLVQSLRTEFKMSSEQTLSSKDKSSENDIFIWNKPASINVVGSYLLGTAMRDRDRSHHSIPLYSIDLAVTLPDDMFKHRDIKGHRYETKRLLFLAVLATKLSRDLETASTAVSSNGRTTTTFSALNWECDCIDDMTSPYLTLDLQIEVLERHGKNKKKRTLPQSHRRVIRINIRPVITPTTFKLAQLLPWKPQLAYSGNMPNDHLIEVYREIGSSISNLIEDSPSTVQRATRLMVAQHNHRIIKEAMMTRGTRELAEIVESRPGLRGAILLAMKWLRPRHLAHVFNTYVVSMLFAHLHVSSHLKQGQDALELFRSWLQWLSKEKLARLAKIERIQTETHGAATSQTRDVHCAPPVMAFGAKMKSIASREAEDEWRPAYHAFSEEKLKSAYADVYEVVLLDQSGYVNVLGGVSKSAWTHLVYEAVLTTTHILENPDQFTFMSLFKTSIAQSDRSIHLRQPPPIASDFDVFLNVALSKTDKNDDDDENDNIGNDNNKQGGGGGGADSLPLLPPHLPSPRLANHLNIYAKTSASSQATHKLQASAIVGSRKSNTKAIEITTVTTPNMASAANGGASPNTTHSANSDNPMIDDNKTREASSWLSDLSQSAIPFTKLDALILQKLIAQILLFQSASPRVEYLCFFHSLSNQPSDSQEEKEEARGTPFNNVSRWAFNGGDCLPSQLITHIGLRMQPSQWQKLLEYGPQAQQDALVSDFVRTWGKDRAGLRKFKDGMILYCVSWGVPPTTPSSLNRNALAANANKHRIIKELIEILMNRHTTRFETNASKSQSTPSKSSDHSNQVHPTHWHVSMLGDDILYHLLKAPERVNADLVGPSFKTIPAPICNHDSQEHVAFVWTQLQKLLRGLKGLTMPIKTLSMPGPLGRGSCASPPEYNPLSDVEISFSQRQHAIRAAAPASQLCPRSIECLVMFESSGAWPDDLEAIGHIKTALYLDLSKNLSEQQGSLCASRATKQGLIIFFKGYTFRLAIFYPRELVLRHTLYKQANIIQRREIQQRELKERMEKRHKMKQLEEEGEAKRGMRDSGTSVSIVPNVALNTSHFTPLFGPLDTPNIHLQQDVQRQEMQQGFMDEDFMRYSIMPKVCSLLHSLNIAYPAYGPTCVLLKKWMAAHLIPLAEFADGLLVDLLVARIFHSSSYLSCPWSLPPAHAYTAFLRMLYFLAHLMCDVGPVIVPLHETHEEGQGVSLTPTSRTNNQKNPLGWSLEKIEKIHQRWRSMDEASRPVLAVYFADGDSSVTNIRDGGNEDPVSEVAGGGVVAGGVAAGGVAAGGVERPSVIDPSAASSYSPYAKIPGVASLLYGTSSMNNYLSKKGWSVDSFEARAILNRSKRLALNALSLLSSIPSESTIKRLFDPSLLDFDIVIELKKSALTQCLSLNSIEKKKKKKKKQKQNNDEHKSNDKSNNTSSSIRFISHSSYLEAPSEYIHQVESMQSKSSSIVPPLLTDFDPVTSFIQKIAHRLSDRSLILHDGAGGHLIALVLKPSSFAPSSQLTNANTMLAIPLTTSDGQRAGCLPNIVQIIHELWTMGEGLVQQIHMVAGHHKLFPSS